MESPIWKFSIKTAENVEDRVLRLAHRNREEGHIGITQGTSKEDSCKGYEEEQTDEVTHKRRLEEKD